MLTPKGFDSHATAASFDPASFGVDLAETHEHEGFIYRLFTRQADDPGLLNVSIVRESPGSQFDF